MYTKTLRTKALREYRKGNSVTEICKEFNISKSCMYSWIKLYSTKKDASNGEEFTYKQLESLQAKFDRLATEHNILKEAYSLLNPTLDQKLKIVDQMDGKYFLKQMCRVIGVHHTTFYNHRKARGRIKQNDLRDEELKKLVLQIYYESGRRFGANKIYQKLYSQGIISSLKKISALMKQLNLKSKRRKKPAKTTTNKPAKFYYKNKLKQNFNQSKPNVFWVGDVTEVKINSAKFYICVVLDLFSRRAIGHRVSSQNNSALIVNTFKDAFEFREKPKGLSFHSDQGTNYTSNEFSDLLYAFEVDQSLSKAGTPYDNSVMESFFSNFKQEDLNSCEFEHFDELVAVVDRYMKYYNAYRPHQHLGFKTPIEYENEYYKNLDFEPF